MAASIDGTWTAQRLRKWLTRTMKRGWIEDFEVSRAGEVVEPGEGAGAVSVPYEISYESAAAADGAELRGSFEMTYASEDERWVTQWTKSLLWPGIDGAARFEVSVRWPRRAPILDRRGRRLAVGRAEKRRYPFGSVGGSTVGHIEPRGRREAADHEVAGAGDLVGASGLEEAFEERVAGRPASRLVVADRSGAPLEVVGRVPAVPGRPAKTTLDIAVQRAAERAYGATVGGVAVIDPQTGDLLAAVGSGPFDPNNYVGAKGVEPFNRALAGLYPPGSAMKAVTAAAALEEGVVKPGTTVTGPGEYKGVRNFESGVFGAIPFASAVRYSVNTAFAQVAEKLGARRLVRYAEAFGFNRPPEMALAAATSSFPFPQGLGDVMWASIGQAQVLASPLGMASVAATIANGGKRMEPRIDRRAPIEGSRAVSRRTAAQMTTLMENVVEGGTGTAARIAGVRVAGKTGTAEVDVGGKRKNHAWFIVFAPAGDPEVAVAVVSEYGGVGGRVAAPLARAVLVNVLPLVR